MSDETKEESSIFTDTKAESVIDSLSTTKDNAASAANQVDSSLGPIEFEQVSLLIEAQQLELYFHDRAFCI